MPTFERHIASDQPQSWLLQVMLDTLAIGESLPLRLINLDEINNLYEVIIKVSKSKVAQERYHRKKTSIVLKKNPPDALSEYFTVLFPEKKNWDSFVDKCVIKSTEKERDNLFSDDIVLLLYSIYPYIERKIFPVLTSNPLPLNYLASIIFSEWRYFSILWLYSFIREKSIEAGSSEIESKNAFGIKHWTVVFCAPRMINNIRYILMAGPVFQSHTPLFSDEEYDNKIIAEVINGLKLFAKQSQDFENYRDRLHRIAHAIPFFPEIRLKQRVARIRSALSSVLNTEIERKYITTHQQISNFGLWTLLGERYKSNKLIKPIPKKPLYLYMQSDSQHNRCDYWLSMEILPQVKIQVEEKPSFSITDEDKNRRRYHQYGFLIEADDLKKEEYDEFCITFVELLSAYTNKNKLITQKHFLLFGEWLQSKAGTLLPSKQNNKKAPSLSVEISGQISRWISDLVRADLCILYQFDTREHSCGVLKANNCYFTDRSNKKLDKALGKDLEVIATKLEKRQRSISYRAVDTGEQRICYTYNFQNKEQTLPPDEVLYHSSHLITLAKGKAPFASALSTPIRYSGRILGVIELSGKHRWQFRYAHKIPLQQISAQLAPFLYQHRFMEAMHAIQHAMLEFHAEKISEQQLYNKLCEAITHLFLCNGCSLWVRDETETQVLNRKGLHNYELPADQISLNTTNSIIAKSLIEIEKDGEIKPFSSLVKEHDGEHVNWDAMLEQGVKLITILPIIESSEGSKSGIKVMATINLYNNNTIDYGNSWQGTIEFMSRYMSFVIGAVNAFISERGFLANVYTHEIWHDASYIADKARKLYSERQYLKNDLEKLRQFITSSWFQQRLPAASISGVIVDKDFVVNLQQTLNSSWFLPAEDIHFFAGMLHNRVAHLFGRDLNSSKQTNHLAIEMGDIPEDIRKLIIDIEEEKLVSFKTIYNSLFTGEHNIKAKGLYPSQNFAPYGVVSRPSLVKIVLRNLLNNAFKYSLDNKNVDVKLEYQQFNGSLVFTITNYAPCLKNKDEIRQVLQKGIRGSNALDIKEENKMLGKGIGLYTVDKVCKHVLRLDFSFREIPQKNRTSIFIAEIIIPPSKVERI